MSLLRFSAFSCPTGGSSEVLCKVRGIFCGISVTFKMNQSLLVPGKGAEPEGVTWGGHWWWSGSPVSCRVLESSSAFPGDEAAAGDVIALGSSR